MLSLYVQAAAAVPEREQSQTEVVVRHLFGRLLHNEAFGEDAASRVAQLAYAIALPGALVALFLFPAYHGVPPHPLERSFSSQACDQLFYVTYSFVILGMTMIFQWDLLFPDLLDVYVLSVLPLKPLRLLLARVSAFAIFLGLVQLGTAGLGTLFLPAVADLRCGFLRHVFAHGAAVTLSGVCAVALLAFLQGVLVLAVGERLLQTATTLIRSVSLVLLLTILFLFPLVAHSLPELLQAQSRAMLLFPPFWFLGFYEVVLWGRLASPLFHELAAAGVLFSLICCAGCALTYPFAYKRRVAQLVEGSTVQRDSSRAGQLVRKALHRVLIRTSGERSTFHFAVQTLFREQRLLLYLAMYGGLALALVLSGIVRFEVSGARLRPLLSADGVRIAVPIVAFLAVAGLRTALLAPIGLKGSWLFRVVDGEPTRDELRGVTLLVAVVSVVLTLFTSLVLHVIAPPGVEGFRAVTGQVILSVGLPLILTAAFFLQVRSIPFTQLRMPSTHELPLALLRYFVIFPAFALTTVNAEPWIESSVSHLLATVLCLVATMLLLGRVRAGLQRRSPQEDDLLVMGLGLREQ